MTADFRIDRQRHVGNRVPRQRDHGIGRIVAGVRIASPHAHAAPTQALVVPVAATVDDRTDGQPIGDLVRRLGIELAEAAKAIRGTIRIFIVYEAEIEAEITKREASSAADIEFGIGKAGV